MKKIYWLTGLPCSGKPTIAKELARHFYAEILDGDNIRTITNNNDFSKEGRAKHMRSVAAFAFILSKYADVVVALVSPLRSVREELKKNYPNLYEIYVKCDLEKCKERDLKGMYAKAESGEIDNFTGVQAEYEEPLNPDVVVRTDKESVEQCVKQILGLHDRRPKALLIGRWQPFHAGHMWLVDEAKKRGHEVVIGIRHTPIDEKNPYSVHERMEMVKKILGDSVDCLVLPDIAGVYYGRGVGYEVAELKPPSGIAAISATKIRESEKGKKHKG